MFYIVSDRVFIIELQFENQLNLLCWTRYNSYEPFGTKLIGDNQATDLAINNGKIYWLQLYLDYLKTQL